MQKRNRSKRGRGRVVVSSAGLPRMSRKERRRGGCSHSQSCSLPATREHFKSIHSIHFHLRRIRPPFPFPLLASLISGLSALPSPQPPIHGLPTTRDYFFLKKISPRFRPHPLVEGKGIVKIRLSLNELVAVERVAKPNFGSHVREREWNEKREGGYKGYKGGRG